MIFCHRHMTLLWFYQHSGQMFAHAHYDRKFVIVNMENRCGTSLAVSKESSKFLRPKLLHIVFLDLTHYV